MKYTTPYLSLSILLAFLFPALAFGATISAGFPAEPIWLSTEKIADGDTVTIFTVLYDQSARPIKGTLIFTVDGAHVGSKQFSLDAGKSEIDSTVWNAVAGSHRIAASITDASDASANQVIELSGSAGTLAVTVAARPAPSVAEQAVASATNIVASVIASSSPVVANAAQGIFALTEAVRNGAAAYLEKQIASSTDVGGSLSGAGAGGSVLGISTERADYPNAATPTATGSWWRSGILMIEKFLLVIVRSLVLFYPLLALIILAILYFLGRRVSRGNRSRT